MSFSIRWTAAAEGDLDSLQKSTARRIIAKVEQAATHPFHFLDMLKGYPYHKLRIGDYRAVIDVRRGQEELEILLVGHRDNVYKLLDRRS